MKLLQDETALFPASSVLVILDPANNEQFFLNEHEQAVGCVDRAGQLVVSASVGVMP